MATSGASDNSTGHHLRADIIRAVGTPLGFFSLVVLVIEAILGGVALAGVGVDRTLAIWGMLVVIVLLIAVVAFFAYYRPEALFGQRYTIPSISHPSPVAQPQGNLLQAEIDRLKVEHQILKDKLASLQSVRRRILAVIGAESANHSTLVSKLGISNDQTASNDLLAVMGELVEKGVIESDRMRPDGYYRLRQHSYEAP